MTAGTTSSLGATRRHPTALLFVFVLAGVLGACTRSEWRELPVSDGGFSVLRRGEPHSLHQRGKCSHICTALVDPIHTSRLVTPIIRWRSWWALHRSSCLLEKSCRLIWFISEAC